jgi:hypothetical protein
VKFVWGFDNLKDVLEVIAIPLVIALIGIYLPKRLENAKSLAREQALTNLVRREIEEAKPFSTNKKLTKWADHLNKRFIHESIVNSANENVDFILNMPPDLIYHHPFRPGGRADTDSRSMTVQWLQKYVSAAV